MRFLEIILLLLGSLLPFIIPFKKSNLSNRFLLVGMVGILVAHILLEGPRWQMNPIYLINIVVIACLLKEWRYFKGNSLRSITSGVFLFLMIGMGCLLSNILPIFDFPVPTGSHHVGSQYLHLTSNEEEYITNELGDKRELIVKVWYPAEVTDENREPYLNDGERIGLATKYGLPPNTFNYLDKVKTNTFISPAFSIGKFPILIFSHGYYSNATGYFALIEEIVSHGYIVLNLNHTYESVGSLFPSGQIKLYDVEYDRKHNNEEMGKMIWEAMEGFKKETTKEGKKQAIKSTVENYFAAEITHRWAKDIKLILKQIPKWETSTFFSNHIDIAKIGIFGHSQGGAAAGQALLDQKEISAGVNIDGTQWGNMIDTFYSKPFLWLSSDWPEEHPNFNELIYQNRGTSDFFTAKIKKSGHSNFMDIPFVINLPMINEAGDIQPKKAIHITSKLVIEFFNKYLKNEEVDLIEMSKSTQELEIEKRK